MPIPWWLCPKEIRICLLNHPKLGTIIQIGESNSHPIWMTALESSAGYQFCIVLPCSIMFYRSPPQELAGYNPYIPIQSIYWNMLKLNTSAIRALQRRRPRMRCPRKHHWPSSASKDLKRIGQIGTKPDQTAALKISAQLKYLKSKRYLCSN